MSDRPRRQPPVRADQQPQTMPRRRPLGYSIRVIYGISDRLSPTAMQGWAHNMRGIPPRGTDG